MTNVSQKCQYALRAVLELAKRGPRESVAVSQIAEAQAIPVRFLEAILAQLRQGGFVQSRRGARGGYVLASAAGKVTVGDIIEFIEGPVAPVKCVAGQGTDCPLHGRCSFMSMWERARDAVAAVYDSTTLQNLLDEQAAATRPYDYCI